MLNMMKADLYRIFKGKAIYFALLIIIIMSLVSVVSLMPGHIGMTSVTEENFTADSLFGGQNQQLALDLQKANSLKEMRNIILSSDGYELDQAVLGTNMNLYYVLIVIVVITVCIDFSNKSIKNTLSSAISRKKYYLSKAILIFLIGTALVLFSNYFFYFINLLVNGKSFTSSISTIFKSTMIQLPLIYGIISLLICFAFVFKKTATFNTISIPFIMLVQLVVLGFTNLFRIKADWLYQYEIQNALGNLVNHPTSGYILNCALLGIFYIVIFNVIGYYAFLKTEIK